MRENWELSLICKFIEVLFYKMIGMFKIYICFLELWCIYKNVKLENIVVWIKIIDCLVCDLLENWLYFNKIIFLFVFYWKEKYFDSEKVVIINKICMCFIFFGVNWWFVFRSFMFLFIIFIE